MDRTSSVSVGIKGDRQYTSMLKAIAGKRNSNVATLVREACDTYLAHEIAELAPFFAKDVEQIQRSKTSRKAG